MGPENNIYNSVYMDMTTYRHHDPVSNNTPQPVLIVVFCRDAFISRASTCESDGS